MRELNAKEHGEITDPFFVGRIKELSRLYKCFSVNRVPVALICGEAGIGKSALALKFSSSQASRIFKKTLYSRGFEMADIKTALQEYPEPSLEHATLFIFDEIKTISKKCQEIIDTFLKKRRKTGIILITRKVPKNIPKKWLLLRLSGLTDVEFEHLLLNRIALAHEIGHLIMSKEEVRAFFKQVSGSPLYANLANYSISNLLITWEQFLKSLKDFKYSGILGPDGKPFAKEISIPSKIILDTRHANYKLLEKIKQDPTVLRLLTPRKFEEIVAELLELQGYKVELTPLARDGGFDMYAASKKNIGRFLYLVECKRYTPPNKVGVQVVRSLYGVVERIHANAGIIATTSFFTKGAKEFQQELKYKLHLNDYIALQKWLKLI